MNRTKVFVDLDDTLINTSMIKDQLIKIISDQGVSVEVAKQRYQQSKNGNGVPIISVLANSFQDYSVEPNYLKNELNKVYTSINESMIYRERFEWILRTYPKEDYKLILMTKGEPPIQSLKIERLGELSKMFDEINIVPTNKAEALLELVDKNEEFVIVDDKEAELKAVEKEYPQAKLLISTSEGNPQPYFNNQNEEPSRREG